MTIKLADETEFTRQLRAIRKYFMKSYKNFIFEILDEIKRPKEDGEYVAVLKIDEIFNKIYGQLQIIYVVKDQVVYIEGFEPKDILRDMYLKLLPTYGGIPYRNNKDLFKIKFLKG